MLTPRVALRTRPTFGVVATKKGTTCAEVSAESRKKRSMQSIKKIVCVRELTYSPHEAGMGRLIQHVSFEFLGEAWTRVGNLKTIYLHRLTSC